MWRIDLIFSWKLTSSLKSEQPWFYLSPPVDSTLLCLSCYLPIGKKELKGRFENKYNQFSNSLVVIICSLEYIRIHCEEHFDSRPFILNSKTNYKPHPRKDSYSIIMILKHCLHVWEVRQEGYKKVAVGVISTK